MSKKLKNLKKEKLITWGNDIISGRAISTYPEVVYNQGTEYEIKRREGEPICDRFLIDILPNRMIALIADGCNWGDKPRRAAKNASDAFADYLLQYQHTITNTHQAARLISRAFAIAHHRYSNSSHHLIFVAFLFFSIFIFNFLFFILIIFYFLFFIFYFLFDSIFFFIIFILNILKIYYIFYFLF